MTQIYSFPPIENPAARVLVLGSMPGVMSLRLQQYYGHPQNAFWRVMGEVLGFDATAGYDERVRALLKRKVALWDVLASCVREGSLDSNISPTGILVNDFAAFLKTHPHVQRVCFNGAKAESLYRKQVLPHLATKRVIEYLRLPSTSPAHAGTRFAEKVRAWRIVARAFDREVNIRS